MIRILLTVLIAIIPSVLFAQKDTLRYGSITGIVKDSAEDYALQTVTITLYRKSDSALLNYQISADDGAFSFSELPLNVPVSVNFSFTGYRPLTKVVTLDPLHNVYDFKNVLLARAQGMMEEVVVKAVVPVTMNGDTLEINPAAFRLDSNAVVEDMLRRVPGVTIWGDGSVTVNGKTVNNVYVDGKPFFGSDPTLATQNLPKNAIEKIQVYQEQDYSKDDVDDNPADSLLTMNIKLRPDKKKGFFGKAGAGIGTNDRYEADASGLAFNKRLRGGIALSSNNINKTANLQEMFQQGTYRNYNPNNKYVANFGNTGVTKVLFLGGNMQYNFSELDNTRFNNQLSANYSFRHTNNTVHSETNSKNSANADTVLIQNTARNAISGSNNNTAGINYNKRDWDKDFSVNLSYTGTDNNTNSSSFTTKSVESGDEISESAVNNISKSNSNIVSLTTSFRNKDDDDRNLKSFGLNYNLSYNDNESERKTLSNLISYDDATQNTYYNRLSNNSATIFNTGLGMNYNALKRLLFGNFNLWDVNMVLGNNINLSRSNSHTRVSDYDSLTGRYIINDYLTNTNQNTHIEEKPSIRLSKNFTRRLSDRFRRYINIGFTAQGLFLSDKNESDFSYRNIGRNYSFFTPSANIAYNYQQFNRYTIEMNLNGTSTPSIPSVDELQPIIDTSTNNYSINLGNAALKPSTTNMLNYTFNYRREQPAKKADYNFGITAGIGAVQHAITDSTITDTKSGVQTTYLLNMNGRKMYNAGFNGGASFKFKNNRILQFNYNSSISGTTSPNYIDTTYTVTNVNNITNSFKVFYAMGDIGNIQVTESINTSSSRQTVGALKSLKTVNYITQGNVNINIVKDLMFSNTLNYVKNSTTDQSSFLWNAFATCRFLKTKQAEVKLSAMDILKQNKNISTTAGINNVSTTISNGLQQFFMVTFSYYPRKFGGGRGRSSRRSENAEDGDRPDRSERRSEMRGQDQEGGFRGGGMRNR
ncbi:MAG: hypothetical protein QM640_06160 [Niabella sp.]